MCNEDYATFLGLSDTFFELYFRHHTTGQYEGVGEFFSIEDCRSSPPNRERDNFYTSELDSVEANGHNFATARVLEIGTGDGNLTWKIAKRASEVVSWDIDPTATAVAQERIDSLGLENVSLQTVDMLAADICEKSYDIVFFVQVLEHVPAEVQGDMFRRVLSLVKPGGALFVSTPNRWVLKDCHDTGKYFIHWLPRRVRVPLAKKMGWGMLCHDPSWENASVLHDYVSYIWMNRAAKKYWGSATRCSAAEFYPTVEAWLSEKNSFEKSKFRKLLRYSMAIISLFIPLNFYLGSKVVFSRPD